MSRFERRVTSAEADYQLRNPLSPRGPTPRTVIDRDAPVKDTWLRVAKIPSILIMTTQRLELCVTPRPIDFVAAIVWTYLRPGPLQLLAAGFGLYPAVLITVNMNMVKAGPWHFSLTLVGTILGLYLFFIGLELAWLAVRLRRDTWRKTHFTLHRLVIDDAGLTSSCEFNGQQVAWKDIRSVQSGLGYVFFRLSNFKIMPIPLGQFEPGTDVRKAVNSWQRVVSRRERIVSAFGWVGVAGGLFIAVKIVTGLFGSFTLDHQVQNGLRLVRKISPAIERFQISRGRLPSSLAELSASSPDLEQLAKDAYDEPLHYVARDEAFVLVSYGRNRRPDGSNYWSTRETRAVVRDTPISRSHFACRDPDADLVVSDRGLHNACSL